jgi:prepilin-type N-terminal cleavage/methylation domain-containing protein
MKITHPRNRERRGFTLVELLVVLVIIGLLASLITIAAVKGIGAARRTGNRVDIGEMDTALSQFKQRFGFYPPSQIILCEVLADYYVGGLPANGFKTQLHQDSMAIISKMFPYISWGTINTPANGGLAWTGIDWDGNTLQATSDVILEGDQCLVFFLGGIPAPCPAGNNTPIANVLPVTTPPACLGFSANPKNPADTVNPDRIGPFYEFNSSRLVLVLNNAGVTSTQTATFAAFRSPLHYSYLDRYGQSDGYGTLVAGFPYAYFSTNKATNSYDPYTSSSGIPPPPSTPFAPAYPYSDCITLGVMNDAAASVGPTGIWPYAETALAGPLFGVPAGRYPNPNTCQIISAGADRVFGSGSVPVWVGGAFNGFSLTWTSLNPPPGYASGVAGGYDDQSNFSGGQLGANDQ